MTDLVKKARMADHYTGSEQRMLFQDLAYEIEQLQKEVAQLKEERRWLEADLDDYEKDNLK